MKRIFTALTLCLVSVTFVFSQEYKVENGIVFMEKVIQTEMTMEQAHDALETFFAGVYGNSNRTNKLNSPNHLVYKGIYKDIASFSMGIWKIHANHNIDVYFKEGRCKVKITCDIADVTNGTNTINYNFADYVPFTDKYKMSTGAPKSSVKDAGIEVVMRMDDTMLGIEKTLKQKPTDEEDW